MRTKIFKLSIAALLAFLLLFSIGCEAIDSISPGAESQSKYESTSVIAESNEEQNESTATESLTESGSSGYNETESDITPETTEPDNIESSESSESESVETEEKTESTDISDIIDTSGYAQSLEDAIDRSKKGHVSGSTVTPAQAPIRSEYMPMVDGKYVKNNDPYYIDENTYVVFDAYGREVFRIYRGGGYITIEEVAAYVYAFGDIPANYVTSKKTKPSASIWGVYLRLNHSKFSGSTSKYPYEPELPRISGCGGDLTYYEIDIGTTGTDCDPGYDIRIYNNGSTITRGAARIVYARFDRNNNQIIDPNEKYVFYTYNHYNDFQEYLNYFGGWGEMFGNVTGGGELSSKTNCNPTPYVSVVLGSLKAQNSAEATSVDYYIVAILPQDLYYTKHIA